MSRATKRILLDVKDVMNAPIDNIFYAHDEINIFKGYALIIGPASTPYENGNYLFEFTFPENYPFSPPKLKFHTYDGFTRFNPNLYINGYVCLSILNTWEGEKWSACQSIRSVLITLSAILNETPLLNEPGITISHKDFNSYNEIIEYKNIEVSILKYLEKANLPYMFHTFHNLIIDNFKKKYQIIIDKIKNKQNKQYNLSVYNNMSALLDYNNLIHKINLIYNEFKN